MKKGIKLIISIILCLVLTSVLFACSGTYVPSGNFYDGMNTSEIYDVLRNANSYSLDINEDEKREKYRFVLKEGYTISEETGYICKFTDETFVYTINYTQEEGYTGSYEVFTERFYTEIQNVYDSYIDKLKETFEEGQFSLDTELKIEISDEEETAVIRHINKGLGYELVVYEAYIFDVNETSLYFLDDTLDYKAIAMGTK